MAVALRGVTTIGETTKLPLLWEVSTTQFSVVYVMVGVHRMAL